MLTDQNPEVRAQPVPGVFLIHSSTKDFSGQGNPLLEGKSSHCLLHQSVPCSGLQAWSDSTAAPVTIMAELTTRGTTCETGGLD